ncbi:Alpha/Beta hydrolase protein [Xylaria cf. heliscus]|nr:Alpha/Beta hydrolase protein [Xylaria cf. heliscus]
MAEIAENPTHFYPYLDRPEEQAAPLILLHDGSGTIMGYHYLKYIGRRVYGIRNPRFDEGGYSEGGIPGMASHYIELIRKVVPNGGRILLGGWSFGGALSLEIAWQLANQPADKFPKFSVEGMIFIDSVYPKALAESPDMPKAMTQPIVKSPEELSAMTPKEKVTLNMQHCQMMMANWKLPNWEGRENSIPETILLRAKEPVPSDDHNKSYVHSKSYVDHTRDDRWLGWKQYHGARWIKKIWDIDGHHFNIFDEKYSIDMTVKITAAADEINWRDL